MFGVRKARRDDFFGTDIQRWQASGVSTLDRRGASLYARGCPEGMGPGVDAAPHQILDPGPVEVLAAVGRYRHDAS